MRIVVFGASGGTGKALVAQALDRGDDVVAFLHDEAKADFPEPVRVVVGDAIDPVAVDRAIHGVDAVLVALGVIPWKAGTTLSDATKNIIAAMYDRGVTRLVVETGAHFAKGKKPLLWRISASLPLLRGMFTDKSKQESVVMQSGLDWVLVRPSNLTNGSLTKRVTVADAVPLHTLSRVSRADVAYVMLEAAHSDTYSKRAVTVTGA
jgi:uncharacterized protein YbjT (DUF2867 family)